MKSCVCDRGYVPLSVREGSPLVRALWRHGIDRDSCWNVRGLEARGDIRKLPIGWWLRGIGWRATTRGVHRALLRGGYVNQYEQPTTATLPFQHV
jgi:hypothetical protein